GSRRFPNHRRIELLGSKAASDDFNALVEIFGRLEVFCFEHRLRETIRAAAFRYSHGLAIEPLERFVGGVERWRIGANQEYVALVVAKSKHRNDPDIADVRVTGRDDARHITDVTDVDFPGEHSVDNDCSLETDLETDVRSLRQVFFVELFVAHDHARP